MIVVVDDQPILVKVMRAHLMAGGFVDVVGTTDPTEAIPLAKRKNAALMILDITMPVMNGLEILQKMREDDELAETPVLIATASSCPKRKSRALALGASEVLIKPIEGEDLVAAARLVLAKKESKVSSFSVSESNFSG